MYQVNSAEVGSVLITVEKICTVYQLTSSVLAGEVGSVVLTVFDIGWEVQSVDLRTVHFTPSTHCSSLCEIQQIDSGIRYDSGIRRVSESFGAYVKCLLHVVVGIQSSVQCTVEHCSKTRLTWSCRYIFS